MVAVTDQGDVVVHVGHLLVRRDPDEADPGGQDAEDVPAQKAQPEDKQLPLVTVHQLPAHSHVVEVATVGIAALLLDVLVDVEGLGVGEGLDNPWDEQQQRPEEDQDPLDDIENEDRQDVLAEIGRAHV